MNRQILLSFLIALTSLAPEAFAQTSEQARSTTTTTTTTTIFATPPSYLQTLKSQSAPRSVGNLPKIDSTSKTVKVVRPLGERKYVWAPTPPVVTTTTYQIVPANSVQVLRAPVYQGFAEKNGKFKLKSVSASAPGGLNSKWLELQERELVEKSNFQPPGSPPHTSLY